MTAKKKCFNSLALVAAIYKVINNYCDGNRKTFAERTGIPYTTVKRIVSNKAEITQDHLDKIARATGVAIAIGGYVGKAKSEDKVEAPTPDANPSDIEQMLVVVDAVRGMSRNAQRLLVSLIEFRGRGEVDVESIETLLDAIEKIHILRSVLTDGQ